MNDLTAILYENSKLPYFDCKFLGSGPTFLELVTCKSFFLIEIQIRDWNVKNSGKKFCWNSCSLYFVSHNEALYSLICIFSASLSPWILLKHHFQCSLGCSVMVESVLFSLSDFVRSLTNIYDCGRPSEVSSEQGNSFRHSECDIITVPIDI